MYPARELVAVYFSQVSGIIHILVINSITNIRHTQLQTNSPFCLVKIYQKYMTDSAKVAKYRNKTSDNMYQTRLNKPYNSLTL